MVDECLMYYTCLWMDCDTFRALLNIYEREAPMLVSNIESIESLFQVKDRGLGLEHLKEDTTVSRAPLLSGAHCLLFSNPDCFAARQITFVGLTDHPDHR